MNYSRSDHFDGNRFFNPWITIDKSFRDLLKWQLNKKKAKWPKWVENTCEPRWQVGVCNGEAALTWINHATFLVQLKGLNVITDPLFSERASPITYLGPRRVRPTAWNNHSAPKIDVVVVSHNHYDHLDTASLIALEKRDQPLFIVPLGNKKTLWRAGLRERIVELDWWQKFPIAAATKQEGSVTLVPAQHWSARGMHDRNQALWGGYVIEAGDVRVHFAGDTGYGPHFGFIKDRISNLDISLLPIGAYEPRWFMGEQHMNPDDAVRAHKDLNTKISLAMHHSCIQLTDEGIEDPLKELARALLAQGITESQFLAPGTGETVLYKQGRVVSEPSPPE